jgi:two-component system, OmpR family, sensor histidine kinase MtrB
VRETAGAAAARLRLRAAELAVSLRLSAGRWLLRLRDRWGRSLQLRVVTATLVLSAVVVTVLGYFLMQRFVADLYASKERSAENVAQVGVNIARGSQLFKGPPTASTSSDLYNLANQLGPLPTGPGPGSPYSQTGSPFALRLTVRPGHQSYPAFTSGKQVGFYGIPELPVKLVRAVDHEPDNGRLIYLWTRMPVGTSGGVPVAGLLAGAKFGTEYEIYYFFPLTAEQLTIASIQRTLLLVGIAAVFLLAAIAWLVTRWVVVPVRQAAHGAWRLSTGHLHERMEVRGTDELAALAASFNEMAASLQEKLEELEDLSQVQRQFVSDVSHELRTPLTTIRIAADVLFGVREQMEPAVGRSAELLQSQLERFESLLTDLLEISRYDANAATLDAEHADIGSIVRQSADVAQQLAERRGARITFRLPPEACIAEVDRRRVERILRNLLQNAVEHGENKDIIVTASADSVAVAVSVRDFGVGLHPGEEQLVFDRFWRADPARARTSGGTGLGLAIALEDARLHGGWLEAWGEPGRGCVFRLTLPRLAGAELQGSPLPLNPAEVDEQPRDYLDAVGATPVLEPADRAAPAGPADEGAADGAGAADNAGAASGPAGPATADGDGRDQATGREAGIRG